MWCDTSLVEAIGICEALRQANDKLLQFRPVMTSGALDLSNPTHKLLTSTRQYDFVRQTVVSRSKYAIERLPAEQPANSDDYCNNIRIIFNDVGTSRFKATATMTCSSCFVLFFSRPRSEGWPHQDVLSPFISVLCHSD